MHSARNIFLLLDLDHFSIHYKFSAKTINVAQGQSLGEIEMSQKDAFSHEELHVFLVIKPFFHVF